MSSNGEEVGSSGRTTPSRFIWNFTTAGLTYVQFRVITQALLPSAKSMIGLWPPVPPVPPVRRPRYVKILIVSCTTGEADEQNDRHDDRRNDKQEDQPLSHGWQNTQISYRTHLPRWSNSCGSSGITFGWEWTLVTGANQTSPYLCSDPVMSLIYPLNCN